MSRLLVFILLGALFVAGRADAAPVRIVRGPILAASAADQAFVRDRVWRMRSSSPVGWFANTWVHQHAFALDAADAAAHPEWQLRDSLGSVVYIAGRPAADFGNADFRAWWIARAQAALLIGYRGVFIEDVLMTRSTTTASGASRTPRDPRTGANMTEANWQRYMADFMVSVRAALGGAEIVHDVLWYKGDAGDVLCELQSADFVSLEKGFNDTTITSGFSTYGYQTLSSWIERRQAHGKGVIFDSSASSLGARVYALASVLMLSNGGAALGNDSATAPGAFWPGYSTDLGAPVSGRYAYANVWRRDFAGGLVLVNEPYRTTQTVPVPGGYRDLDGVARTSVTLAGGTGAVLVAVPRSPEPTPEPPTDAPPTPVSPPTPVAPSKTPVPPVATTPTSSGNSTRARISTAGRGGARGPAATRTSVRGSRTRVRGSVRGAVAGTVRLVIERRRGTRWAVARRESVTVKRSGSFVKDIRALPSGTYRVRGSFQGTGTSQPSRSAYSGFRA